MRQEIKITVPKDWSAVKLHTFLQLQKDLDTYGDTEEGYTAALLYHLCGFNPEYLRGLDTETFTKIKGDIFGFYSKQEYPLQRIIKVNGHEYGFEPNLSKIAYGAYLDIVKYDTFQIDKNWANIMSILYRPIVKRVGDMYQIEEYKGELYPHLFEDVTMDIHFGALFFFVHLLTGLPKDILNSLMVEAEIPPSIKSILTKSGETIRQLYNLPVEISERLKK